uniref:Uncharacterized protein n=1 Tax=Setaria digitata TaxID=48799 RepID=A0A915PUF7_9BILA
MEKKEDGDGDEDGDAGGGGEWMDIYYYIVKYLFKISTNNCERNLLGNLSKEKKKKKEEPIRRKSIIVYDQQPPLSSSFVTDQHQSSPPPIAVAVWCYYDRRNDIIKTINDDNTAKIHPSTTILL